MITIVFGKPSCGKTAYMTADAVKYMNNSAECLELQRVSFKQVVELNAEYTLPARQPDVDDAFAYIANADIFYLSLSVFSA